MNIAFASPKGGVGKSTACAAIAAYLAAQGETVKILDLDERKTCHRWKTETDPHDLITVQTVTVKDFEDAYDAEDTQAADHILFDLPGAKDNLERLYFAFSASHIVIIPMQLSEPDLNDALDLIRELARFRKLTSREVIYRVLYNMVQAGPILSRVDHHIYDEVRDKKILTFSTPWVKRTAYREMFLNGVGPHERDSAKAGAEIAAVVDEIQALTAPPKRARQKAG